MATEIHARPDWTQVMNQVVDIALGGTWPYEKIVVLLRGLPGSGKSTFCDLLVHELRTAFEFYGQQRFVRLCSSAFGQVLNGHTATEVQRLVLEDFTASLRVGNVAVVILDDVNILEAEWAPFAMATSDFFRELRGGGGVICEVTFACRDEDHAFRLCGRSWRQLHAEEVREYYGALLETPEIPFQGILPFSVNPDI